MNRTIPPRLHMPACNAEGKLTFRLLPVTWVIP